MGLRTDDICLFAFLWRDGYDEDDVFDAILERYEDDGDDDPECWHTSEDD